MNGWGARVEKRMGHSSMSVFHAMISLGAGRSAMSGYIAVSPGPGVGLHFRPVALIGGGFALLAMIPAREPGAPTQPKADARPLVALPTGPHFLIGPIVFPVSMGEGAMADWSAMYLRVAVEASDAENVLGDAAFSSSMVIVRLVGGALVERFDPVGTTRASAATAFAGLMIAILSDNLAASLPSHRPCRHGLCRHHAAGLLPRGR